VKASVTPLGIVPAASSFVASARFAPYWARVVLGLAVEHLAIVCAVLRVEGGVDLCLEAVTTLRVERLHEAEVALLGRSVRANRLDGLAGWRSVWVGGRRDVQQEGALGAFLIAVRAPRR
jgi:hypothetical protein